MKNTDIAIGILILCVAAGVVVVKMRSDGAEKNESVSSSSEPVSSEERIYMVMGDDEIDVKNWTKYSDKELGITFEHPSSYVLSRPVQDTETTYWDDTIKMKNARFIFGEGTVVPMIIIDRTHDPVVLQTLTQDHPFEDVIIAGKHFKKFRMEGMLDPMGFVLQEKPDFVFITFLPALSAEAIEKTLSSIKIAN